MVQGFRAMPTAMAGVMRMLWCIRHRFVVGEEQRQGRPQVARFRLNPFERRVIRRRWLRSGPPQ
jgi:hypothetical protein